MSFIKRAKWSNFVIFNLKYLICSLHKGHFRVDIFVEDSKHFLQKLQNCRHQIKHLGVDALEISILMDIYKLKLVWYLSRDSICTCDHKKWYMAQRIFQNISAKVNWKSAICPNSTKYEKTSKNMVRIFLPNMKTFGWVHQYKREQKGWTTNQNSSQ